MLYRYCCKLNKKLKVRVREALITHLMYSIKVVHSLLTFLAGYKALWCKLIVCIVWTFDISITHAEMWHFFVVSVLHPLQKETGPLHQLRPKEESQ